MILKRAAASLTRALQRNPGARSDSPTRPGNNGALEAEATLGSAAEPQRGPQRT